MRRLSDLLYSYSNWVTCILFTVIMVAYASIGMGHAGSAYEDYVPEGYKVLDLKLGYSVGYVTELFQSMGTEGLKGYLKMVQIWDNLFPIVYGLMNLFILSLIFKSIIIRKPSLRYINLLPILPMILDWIENAMEGRLILQYLDQGTLEPLDVSISSIATLMKWGGTSFTFLAVIVGIILLIVDYRSRTSSRHH